MDYSVILFDLDGTLTDPRVGITRCVQLALSRFGIAIDDPDELTPYIGPPLLESFQQRHGLSAEQAKLAVGHYRERFAGVGLYENEVYPGIPELLAELHGDGATLIVATSKPTVFAEQILTHFGLDHYFDLVVGSNLDHTRVAKTEVVAHVLAQRPDRIRESMVMVGDREHDVIGARQNGVAAIGVSYGYGGVEELQAAGAIAIAASVAELRCHLAG